MTLTTLLNVDRWDAHHLLAFCSKSCRNVLRDSIMQAWAERHEIELDYIQPGKPQQNAYVERFNRTAR
ncbi:MAG: transposase [Rhodocyclaceae bacterium]|nr:transposase [Rhodocyclaceae bacterium]